MSTHIPYRPANIEEDVDFSKVMSVLDRYYLPRYILDVHEKHNDHCILFHSNRLCVLTLAPSHPLLLPDKVISKVIFQVAPNLSRLDNKTSGKLKHGAQPLNENSPICFIECSDGTKYTIYSTVLGKLLEINEKLVDEPQLLLDRAGKGYIAIISTNIEVSDHIKKNFLNNEKYFQAIENRKQAAQDSSASN